MKGTLYGIGVGPGDPELITRKAERLIRACPVAAVPGEEAERSVAYRIAVQAVPELAEKEVLAIPMPMSRDASRVAAFHEAGAVRIAEILESGRDVAFLTLGDPTIYSTYIYLHRQIEQQGYPTEIVSGIPSFCAAAARLGESLAERDQTLHIIPSSYPIADALSLPGTKVLMKSGKKIGAVREALLAHGGSVAMIENCGMEGERSFRGAEQIPEDAGYYTLLIVRDQGESDKGE